MVNPVASEGDVPDMGMLLKEIHVALATVQGKKDVSAPIPDIPWCILWFVGDSTSSDHAATAMCQLFQLGYEIQACNAVLGAKLYGDNDSIYCSHRHLDNNNTKLYGNGFEMKTSKETPFCPNVRVRLSAMKFPSNFPKDEGGVILRSHGVHCNDPKCMEDHMREEAIPDFNELFAHMSSEGKMRYFPMWREHEPQHFYSPPMRDGLFHGRQSSRHACDDNITTFNNYRNEIAEKMLRTHSLYPKVQIVRIYDALKYNFHYNKPGDCTHLCFNFNGSRFFVTWHGIVQGLRSILRQPELVALVDDN
eukprot:scaffold16636_cov237-Amphora_coffeaeformis.AAC.3